MKKVVLKLKGRKVLEKVSFGRLVSGSLDGNDDFPDSSTIVSETNTATDQLETAYNEAELARQIAKEKTTLLRQKEKAFDNVMNKVGNYVENASGDDEAKIISAGLQVKAKGVRHDDFLPMPEYLSVDNTDNSGEVVLKWAEVEGAKSYNIEICLDPKGENAWKYKKSSTKLKVTISGLQSGQCCWFRVSALNWKGEGPFSEPVSRMVH